MVFLKLAYHQRKLEEAEDVFTLFERFKSKKASLLQSGSINTLDATSSANCRYSFIGYDPVAKIWQKDGSLQLVKFRDFCDFKKSSTVQIFESEGLFELRKLMRNFHYNGKSPVPFCGGLVGYLSYDYGATFEQVEQKVFDDLHVPDFVFFLYDKVIAVDHWDRSVYFLAVGATDSDANRKVEVMLDDVRSPRSLVGAGSISNVVSSIDYPQYAHKIEMVRELLCSGDTYQVNFSQRFSADCDRDPWAIYLQLSKSNPSPYAFYFDHGDFQIVSSSPELLVRLDGCVATTQPIKGTVPRGKTLSEDRKFTDILLQSEKNAAELAMIVDLERNDLGKVCDPGSVRVLADREVQKYATVIHTVSTIEGKLTPNKDFFDLFYAMFPGGSITGCPKKRTMEIIDQLEDFKRGVYTGSAGYIGFNGDAQMNILIRTILVKGGRLYYHAGGGIVIDSDAKEEFEETIIKVKAMTEIMNH